MGFPYWYSYTPLKAHRTKNIKSKLQPQKFEMCLSLWQVVVRGLKEEIWEHWWEANTDGGSDDNIVCQQSNYQYLYKSQFN